MALNDQNPSFSEVMHGIKHGVLYNVSYNIPKTKAIVGLNDGSAVYVDFETHKTLKLMEGWINNFIGDWLTDTVAVVEGSCGTGCAHGFLFIAPDKVVTCSEYNRENDAYVEDNPKSRTNRPLIVDPDREIYICYDAENRIQIFPFPEYATIMPPKGYAPEQVEIIDGYLHITYENQERESEVQIFSLR